MRPISQSTAAALRRISWRVCARRLALAAGLLAASDACAHPHVWVTIHSDLVYRADGAIAGIRHHWTFDDMFSAFALQGIPHKKKDAYTREELSSLAEVNVTSLKEYGYFTRARADNRKLVITDPVDYWLEYAGSALTLHFTLPLQKPVAIKDLMFEIYDPTWFVDFTYADKNPVTLVGAPPQCRVDVQRPTGFNVAQGQQLGEAFFNSLGSSSQFGAQFANKVFVQCR
ncbi:MAG TPA: DUF1007 family protein [Xanthobacteraceae bacterium]|nr:DUF1007 family protein [Xanthobacteraceae bacterium]